MKQIWWWTQRHILRRWVCPRCGKELEKVIRCIPKPFAVTYVNLRPTRACIARCGYREDA